MSPRSLTSPGPTCTPFKIGPLALPDGRGCRIVLDARDEALDAEAALGVHGRLVLEVAPFGVRADRGSC